MGSGLPMFSEYSLMLYQQYLQLWLYFVNWRQIGGYPDFPLIILQNNYSGSNS